MAFFTVVVNIPVEAENASEAQSMIEGVMQVVEGRYQHFVADTIEIVEVVANGK